MMPKYITVFVIFLCMHPLYAQQLIQLGNGMTLVPLSQIGAVDVEKLECSPQLAEMNHSMKAWSEILEKKDQLDSDIEALKKVQDSIQDYKKQEFHPQVLLQVRHIHKQIFIDLQDSHFSDLSPYQAWRNEEIEGLQGQLNLLDATKDSKESEECCDKIEKLIDRLMKEREQIKKECSEPNITINIINSKATKVQETEEVCKGAGVTINTQPSKSITSEAPESQPSEPSSEGGESTEDEEDKDDNLDTKEHASDFTKNEPLAEKEEESQENFKEYGYGYWARFMLAYPKKLPNGKDAPWYFISRLTSNKKYDNSGMGDRILAVWLGKGYYHFTTCDAPKSNPNVNQNVNYPDDIDGLWTYVYYSYSVEKKKAVAFIKFGDDDEAFKTVAHDVTHPETKYLKFIIGGKDADRYPAFNGVITSVYYNNKEGAFKDSDEEVLGFLQAQKKQPQSVIPSLMSYKLLAQPVTRTPATNEIHQIIGGAKARFPHEYAFSGWFKWTPLEKQEEWHNAFRVQITTPSTDKFLGDRTLSMWVGKTGGILHLPTYTYTTMEGAGNNNLFKNIAHKDRITKWFFVYFGYSKKEKNAYAFVQFTEEEESQDYEKVNHFTVPKFYVFIGKDKHFQGFSGQIAHAAFVMGEGSFKKGSDFKGKNDPFRFVIGAKQLTGTKPAGKEEDSADVDDGVVYNSSTDENKPKVDESVEADEHLTEYGYGFWARYLTMYPTRMQQGLIAPWYFVSRLTINKNYGNIEMGDRSLAIWQGQGRYVYCTHDAPTKNPNVVGNMVYPNDIEGVWTFFYYSYSVEAKKAVGFAKYGTDEPKQIVQDVTHPTTKFLRFIVGGKDANRYPGFNGLFSQVYFNHKDGAFIDSLEEINDYIKRSVIPVSDLAKVYKHELVEDQIKRKPNTAADYDEVGGGQQKFPHEYAISGWFKWDPVQQSEWHNVFRVQIKKPSTDRFLGDRTLSCWVGKSQGILHFPTYTYTGMKAEGNPNLVKNISHKNRHVDWFFVYFGYSKNQRKAFVGVRFSNSIETIEYSGVNHYYTPKFYSYVGKDQHFSGFSGKIAYVNFALGEGSFRGTPNFKHPEDIFGLAQGESALLKKPVVKPEPTVDKETGDKTVPNAVNDNKPKVNKEFNSEEPLQEYGYGYWARFLTNYPVRLYKGKNAAWYFMSRMSTNAKYGNVGMGDRALAIWQGQGFYLFTTCSTSPANPNMYKKINYPADIEGLWTYVYYSHSVAQKKTVGFIKFGDQEVQSVDFAVTHPTTKYVRYTLGGKDSNTYPGFNGQFTQLVFSATPGAFIDSAPKFNEFLSKKPSPVAAKHPLSTTKLVEAQVSRTTNVAPAKENVQVQFPKEYAISGWFKWEPTKQEVWHNAFRVQIQTPSTDRNLGDRTLSMWLGTGAGGILHISTYTYTNMNGGGSPNMPQNIQHKNRHLNWFYVYFGYSKNEKHGNAYVKWTEGDNSLDFKNVNHYFTSTFYVFAGKDNQFPGFNGQVAYISFNAGEGAYKKGTDFTHPTDIFRVEKGQQNLFPKVDPQKPVVDEEKGELVNAFNNNAPRVDKELNSADNLAEYGYGFWARFLTAYPQRLISGKNAPWYFVSRLTVNKQYDNVRMGDRTLAIWQGQGYYHFTTCNTVNNQVNVIQNINYPADIEGVWTYVYYSYSVEKKKAVAFIKFGNEEAKTITHAVTHPVTKNVRFILGGMDNNRYPAFNGIFTQVTYGATKGIFIDNVPALNAALKKQPVWAVELSTTKLIAGVLDRSPAVAPNHQAIGDDKTKLPEEYAFSGWFKWEATKQEVWHNAFRVQINSPSTDRFLGDRTLSMWVGTSLGGILHFPTYTYANMNGAGNPNLVQNIVHKDRHTKWFFVYFGYSKAAKAATAYVKWADSEDSLNYANCNHYFAPKFYVFLGKDNQFPGFSGKIAYANFNLGDGSYKKGNDYTHPSDAFSFGEGAKELFKPVKPDAPPEADKQVHENKHDDKSPKYDKSSPAEATENLAEYGYGFWLRFLTAYPTRLINGKNQPWYFVSRLTVHQEYDNIRMGDRTLAIWQGQGNYIFVTCNIANNQVNVVDGVNYPADIEGVWTYVYYSYSAAEKQAVGFIKYGDQDFQQVTQKVTNPPTKQVRFIVGGNDEGRYPGLNGLFTQIYFNNKPGAYVNSVAAVNKFLTDMGAKPTTGVPELVTKEIIGNDEITRSVNDNPVQTTVTEKRLPEEYSFSGWFLWKPVAQAAWHNVFRVTIKDPSTDAFLGDRTFACWVGTSDGGILHFPTYTYTNMNGGGNTNLWKNIVHKDRHTKWFFVYFGYSKKQQLAQVSVKWSDSEDKLEYANTNHYLASDFFVYTGRDKHFPGFSGKISNVKFNIGVGAFKKGPDYTHDGDAFGFKAGVDKYHKKGDDKPVEVDRSADKAILDNAHDKKEPQVDKNISSEKDLNEYGYGFWARYLTVYPTRLLSGKNAPWYFVARLTANKEYDNIRMSDRTLAIWQGQGYYHFTTCNQVNGNVNVIQNINYPDDIEGVWTFIYYSYSDDANEAVGIIKYGNDEPKSITHKVTHPSTKFVRFILGGNDEARYPGFNGQFTGVTFLSKNAFIGNVASFNQHLKAVGTPGVDVDRLVNTKLVDSVVSRAPEDEPSKYLVVGGGENKFPLEYAISGWFRWKPTAQQAWHNLFRVQIKTPSTDNFLGDRTLTLWVGTPEGGILHFPTYTYTNMNAGGNANYYKNIAHKNRHTEWFFVYFGYSKVEATAFSYVKWTESEDSQTYEKSNHYLTPEFYVFVGRDKQFAGHSGSIGFVNFNLGKGAFRKGEFAHSDDVFGLAAGIAQIKKESETKVEPGDSDKTLLTNSFEQKKPVIDKDATSDANLVEYGYGFWARFLTVYPTRLISGKNQPWYFVARLTANKEYDNIRMSDRTLAIWQGQGYYHFTTCNLVGANVNVIQNINFPDDIEGVWTYIYYSYSDNKNKAVGFIKYGNEDFKSITHDVSHPKTKFVRFILGGNDEARYPGFNGIFTQVAFSAKSGAFIDKLADLKAYLATIGTPDIDIKELHTHKLVETQIARDENTDPIYKAIGSDAERFPQEYAFSGWFKWTPVTMKPWHNLFRVQIKTPSTDQFLGDRTLSCWTAPGILHFPTYTYTNMNGAGNANHVQNINHKDRHTQWFFIYFGYSKKDLNAYIFVKWTDSEDALNYDKINHYLVQDFFVFVGKDKHFPGFSGKIGHTNFNIGPGAFKKGANYEHPADAFGYKIGLETLVQKKPTTFGPSEAEKGVLENAHDAAKPTLDKEASSETHLEEYGYGFWARFLTVYPVRLLAGKNQPWYFVARLTANKEYDNIRMSDRTLAIWQGQGYYHFTTCNAATNNVNQIANVNFPEDIEGLWTFIYYSYSVDANKAVAFIKYGDADIQSAVHATTHPVTKFVRFILGGTDDKRYPGFNGLFTSVTFSTKAGAFVDSAKDLAVYLEKNTYPSVILSELVNNKLVDKPITRVVNDEPLFKSVGKENKFPHEYAISGWFQWTPVAQQPWHNIFRVTIKDPSTDAALGDRTLTCWLGAGILHFPTYTYANMNGAGNVNHVQNINHKDRHTKWFFVYFGYQKKSATAYIFVKWSDSEDSLTYEKINHYYTPEFFVYVGRDKHFPGFNGKIGHVNFNAGAGAFVKGSNYDQEKDVFGFKAGLEGLQQKKPAQFTPSEAEKGVLENAHDAAKPTLDKEASSETHLEEYGYGFWARFLTVYPVRLLAGKNQPWYFVARLTANKEYDNIRMSDRTLAIWQGQGYYHFTTCNAVTNNVNQIANVNFPEDIEGLWTFIYYSYSVDANKAVAFIKYGDADIQSAVHATTHPVTKFVRFILGGTDDKRYPGFNGLFTSVTFSTKAGAFVDSAKDLAVYLEKNTYPSVILSELVNNKLVDNPITRLVNDEPLFKSVGKENKFPHEYAISGWFQWTPVAQQPWHNIFRVTIKDPSTDAALGDRTLTCWLGAGILHFPTYTYANMNGAGNVNHVQNINHKDRHTKWFFVYFGYQKKSATAYIFVKWSDSEDSLTYEKINHYYTPEFFVYVGRDKHFPGFNGKIGYINFNAGAGAFLKGPNYDQEKDFFGFKAGMETLLKKKLIPFEPTEAEKGVLENAHDAAKPTLEKEASSETHLEEYGYGFWARFLTVYPVRLLAGKNQPWYFVARLTANKEYDNIRMSDRTLAIWQGQGYYHFTTCNAVTNNVNQIANVNFPEDIEGLWTFIYYSYSADANKAVAFIKYGDAEIQSAVHATTHPVTKFVRFILGGTDDKRYPGFNGLFTSVTFSTKAGAFVDSPNDLAAYLAKDTYPSVILSELVNNKLVDKPITRVVNDEPLFKSVGKQNKFPHEYAISGWFQWTPVAQQPWHNIFRVTIKDPSTDAALGDRTLTCWLGAGILHFPTYTYANMNGAGNVNHVQNINHKDRHTKWFFVYFGYQKKSATAYIFVKWSDSEDSLTYEKINHYYTPEFFVYVGRDKHFPGFNGKIGHVNFNAGAGAFVKGSNYDQEKDVFGFKAGLEGLQQKKPAQFTPSEAEKGVLENAHDAAKPTLDKEASSETHLEEYGYGFWARFLTVYPVRLLAGKNQPWYFVARLTANKEYDNIRMSDRTLAIWQGQGYYHFTTCNAVTNNVNQIANVNFPEDIEGLWTFIYYSYSVDANKAVAFIKYGDADIQSAVHATTHPVTKFVRFILGGTDDKRYPGFNGLFTSVTFSTKAGAFVDSAKDLAVYLEKNTYPSVILSGLVNNKLVDKPITRVVNDEPLFKSVGKENKFPHEYAISGWFQWTPVAQQPWHNIFRVTIKDPSTDAALGDRTLTCWLGAGILHFPTYTYANMNGAGNVNHVQNINHKDRHTKWFFVYFGYQKKSATAYIFVKWSDSEDSLTYEKINHYYTPEFFVYVGRDKHFPGFNGKIGYVNFNAGAGAFLKGPNYDQEKDFFGFKAGMETLLKKKQIPFEPTEAEKGVLQNAHDAAKPTLDKEASSETHLEEYGYGFWARFLTVYPVRLLAGKNQPWYFVARLTANKEYDNIRMSDRTLAIWQGQGYYHFTTCNAVTNNVNQIANVNFPEDIEGLWTFIYYSYSVDANKAVAFIKYGDADIQSAVHATTHPVTKFVRFILGGTDDKRYPGFNGLFTSVTFSTKAGAFVDSPNDLAAYLAKNTYPSVILSELVNSKLIENPITRIVNDEPLYKSIGKENKFPHEYAISGWFKWTPVPQQPWHNIFRVSIKDPSTDAATLGDRTLTCWLGAGILHFPTYTYANMNGAGNVNHVQNINHKDRHNNWFFVYYGYQKKTGTAYIFVKWSDSDDSLTYDKINHYYVPEFFVYIGRDKHYPGFNGKIGFVNFNAGEGAYRKGTSYGPEQGKPDVFDYGQINELNKPIIINSITSEKEKLLPSKFDQVEPVFDAVIEDSKDTPIKGITEYGWALWCRWSRTGPTNLLWKQDWHTLARFTINKNHGDAGAQGDRTLSTWVGRGYYHFTTYTPGNNNVVSNTPYKTLDGEWNFITFTYKQGLAKSIVWLSENNIVANEMKVTHLMITDYIHFQIKKEFSYQLFNGHYTNVQVRLGHGAFVDEKDFKLLATGQLRLLDSARYNQDRKSVPLQKEKKVFALADKVDDIIVKPEDAEGKGEYAISGWAKWTDPAAIAAWHLLIRVTTNSAALMNNANSPGDRTLAIWKGAGYYHFCTYNVDQENGGSWGVAQNSDYQGNLHKTWTFFYFGYSKALQKLHAYVKYPSKEDHLDFVNINHLVPTQFLVQMHLDKWHGGFNGAYEAWYFNAGKGAYTEKGYGDDENEVTTFGFGGKTKLVPKAFTVDEPFTSFWGPDQVVGKEVTYADESVNGLTEYGYGMWTRFAWNGPKKMVSKPAWLALSRLTLNENYQGDAAQIADRCLAIWVGTGYFHFTTSTPGNNNAWTNVNYNQMLDGQWNYVYFGYKKTPEGGKVAGHILFNGLLARSTNYGNIVHPVVADFLYFAVGSSGAKLVKNYHSFNGIISKVTLVLGDGGYQESADVLRKALPAKPTIPEVKDIKKVIVKEQIALERADDKVAPKEFADEFQGATAYSVSLWYKWSPLARVAWENIYSLTQNEPGVRANNAQQGDRVLSLFQYSDSRQLFSTYTTPDIHDAYALVHDFCGVPAADQTQWLYAYMGYSREAGSVQWYLKTKSSECEKKSPAMHITPKYFSLFVGKDGIHTPFNGRISEMYLYAGKDSYREIDHQGFEPYVNGALSLAIKPFRWGEKKALFEQPFDLDTNSIEFKPEEVDGQTSYGYGFWMRYLTTIPKRVLAKPAWMQISRLTVNKDGKDMTSTGDRTLAVWVGQGYYHFTTYNQNGNAINLTQNIDYGSNLEGVWTFLYFSYSIVKQSVVGFIKFGNNNEVKRIAWPNIVHRSIENYAKFTIGKQFTYEGFNGQIAQLQVIFGNAGYIHDVESLEEALKTQFTKPESKEAGAVIFKAQDEQKEKKFDDKPQMTEWPTEFKESLEYSIFGWFKYTPAKLAIHNTVFIRLTANEPAYRKEYEVLGDRTLLIMYQPNEVVFATYSLGKVDSGFVNNIRKPTPLGNNYGVWTYVWFGYSWNKQEGCGVAKFPTSIAKIPYENVQHMVPRYFALFAGSDGYLGGWVGPMAKVGALFGKGAYVDTSKGNYENLMPEFKGFDSNPTAEWKPENDDIVTVPKGDKPGYDLTFKEQAGGVNTYGYGMWTRWLMTTPDRVVEKQPWHQMIRLTSTEKYEDMSEFGNRVLAIWTGKGYYHFTTYDKATNKVTTNQNVNYDDYLEGHWNYIYFSYTAKDKPRAVGFVVFGDLEGQVSRVEFPGVTHNPLNGYARVTVASKEFAYAAFNGMVAKLRVYFGKGFIDNKEDLLKNVITANPKPVLNLPLKTNMQVLKDQTGYEKGKDGLMAQTDKFAGVLEYAVSGWVRTKGNREQTSTVFRLTINAPTLLKDNANAGDRTLAGFVNKDNYIYSTYDYGNLDTNDDDKNDINNNQAIGKNQNEWTFMYFGYNSKIRKAFAYTLFTNREDSYQYNDLKHFVPNNFWIYLGSDKFYPTLDGTLFNWNLHFGEGSYTTKPKETIEIWAYEPKENTEKVLSALLGNQGLNSVKLIKEVPTSGKLEGSAVVVSGQFEKEGGAVSGQVEKGTIPKSGEPAK